MKPRKKLCVVHMMRKRYVVGMVSPFVEGRHENLKVSVDFCDYWPVGAGAPPSQE